MSPFGQKGYGWGEAMTTGTVELEDTHVELDGLGADGQVFDMFASAGLVDGVAGVAAVGTNAEALGGCHGEAIALEIAVLLAEEDFIPGQAQQGSPERESGSRHGSPSGTGDLPGSPFFPTIHYTQNGMFSPNVAENRKNKAISNCNPVSR